MLKASTKDAFSLPHFQAFLLSPKNDSQEIPLVQPQHATDPLKVQLDENRKLEVHASYLLEGIVTAGARFALSDGLQSLEARFEGAKNELNSAYRLVSIDSKLKQAGQDDSVQIGFSRGRFSSQVQPDSVTINSYQGNHQNLLSTSLGWRSHTYGVSQPDAPRAPLDRKTMTAAANRALSGLEMLLSTRA